MKNKRNLQLRKSGLYTPISLPKHSKETPIHTSPEDVLEKDELRKLQNAIHFTHQYLQEESNAKCDDLDRLNKEFL